MSLLASIAIAAGLGASAAAPAERPVRLVIERSDADVTIRVVGRSREAVHVTYTLETTNRSGGNRTRQRGSAELAGDRDTVLLTARLAQAAAREWEAALDVEWSGGSYEVRETAP